MTSRDQDSGPDDAPPDYHTDRSHAPDRRRFMKGLGMSGLATASAGVGVSGAWAAGEVRRAEGDEPAEGLHRITLVVNGKRMKLDVTPSVILLDALRDHLQLTGTKKGCDHGQCGACNLHVNGSVINSCLSLAVMHDGDEITTIEGLSGEPGKLGPVQQAFLEEDAYQCGYCTSGQMMTADYVLRDENIASDDDSVREAMSGNLCRCGAYKNILAAVQSARGKV